MPYNISALKVKGFATWKSGFDRGEAVRKAGRMKSYQIFQATDDPHYIVIITEWNSMEDGLKFLQSEELKEANIESGVIEMFSAHDTSKSLEEVEKKSL